MLSQDITKYYDEIYRFCYHHIGSRQAAEDLCQDTFVSFLENAGSHGLITKTKSYLYTIARNKCIDYVRKKKPVYMDELPEQTDGERDASFGEVEMRELLSHLEEDQREVIILRYFQNLKYREIAEVLQISVSKAKFLTARAIERLQKEVE
ncbi:MAG: RNA polymerase sigma factor [Acetatifactor sp.]